MTQLPDNIFCKIIFQDLVDFLIGVLYLWICQYSQLIKFYCWTQDAFYSAETPILTVSVLEVLSLHSS